MSRPGQTLIFVLAGLMGLWVALLPSGESVVAAAPELQGPALADGAVVQLAGTAHLWVAEGGQLHWAGDTRALEGRSVTWSDRHQATLDELRRYPRGDPWLSAGLLKLGDPIYQVKWETGEPAPRLLHIRSIDDVELFGIDSANYGALVLERADWEQRFGLNVDRLTRGVLPSATRQPAPRPCLPAVDGWAASPTGITARVRNPCGERRVFGLSLVLSREREGQPVAVTGQAMWEAAPGDSRTVTLSGSSAGGTWARFLANSAPPGPSAPPVCEPVPGASACLETDPWLRGAIWTLAELETGRRLLRAAADAGVVLVRARVPAGALAVFRPSTRTIVLDPGLDARSDWERAAVLAHELRHAADAAAGALGPGAACLRNEEESFRAQADVWSTLWPHQLPRPQHVLQEELNGVVGLISRDPTAFVQTLTRSYRHQCGA
jgi:hypothetical protein